MQDSGCDEISLRAAAEGEPRRLPQLDILRGIAIVLVLFHHSLVLPGDPGFLRIPYNAIAAFGWSGVDLFFVLSGFLIGGILFREIQRQQSLQVGRFLLRRAFKIWPGYLVLVAYAYLGHMRHGHPLEVIRTYWANLLHLQNYFLNIRFHTWSLAVEEHFYLLLPVLLGALTVSSIGTLRRFFLPIALLIMGIIALFRSIHGIFWPFTFESHMYPTHLRLDSLLAGVCIAFIATFHGEQFDRLKKHRVLLMIVGLGLIAPMTMLDIERSLFANTAGLTLLYAGYGCIMIAVLGVTPRQGVMGKVLSSPPGRVLTKIGFFSYAIYLWHIDWGVRPVAFNMDPLWRHIPATMVWPVAMLLCFSMAIIAGVVMTYLVERPALALRDRLVPRRAADLISRQIGQVDLESPVVRELQTQT